MISQNPIARVAISVIKRLIGSLQIDFEVDKCTNVTVLYESTNAIVPFESTDVTVLYENTNIIIPFDITNVGAKCHT